MDQSGGAIERAQHKVADNRALKQASGEQRHHRKAGTDLEIGAKDVFERAGLTPLEPRFGTFDGLRIRYAHSSGANEHTLLLTAPWPDSTDAFTRCGERSPSTLDCSPSTSPGSGPRSVGTS